MMKLLRSKLEEVLQAGFSDEALAAANKQARSIADTLTESIEYGIKGSLAYNLASHVERMATNAVEALLAGNDEMMRGYLSCDERWYTGRGKEHPVIHGALFETGCIELRKKIVDAHAELLKSERIMDLEDQVRSLVLQVNKLEADNRDLRRRQSEVA